MNYDQVLSLILLAISTIVAFSFNYPVLMQDNRCYGFVVPLHSNYVAIVHAVPVCSKSVPVYRGISISVNVPPYSYVTDLFRIVNYESETIHLEVHIVGSVPNGTLKLKYANTTLEIPLSGSHEVEVLLLPGVEITADLWIRNAGGVFTVYLTSANHQGNWFI